MENTSGIRSKAMIVRLTISQWTGKKIDGKVSKEVAESHGASVRDAGQYNKFLVGKSHLEAISKLATRIRTFHYENTLPWLDGGARLLPAKNFFEYSRQMREFKREFEGLVADFINRYPSLVEYARIILNGMFNETDYPPVEAIEGKFGVSFQIDPMPDSADFRVDLGDEVVAQIQADIEQRVAQNVADAHKDLWRRLHEAVAKIANKLSNPEGIFRDSMIGNLVELVGVLPRLNLMDDPALDAIRRDVESKLCAYEPQHLREDALVRSNVALEARSILESMSGFMSQPLPSEPLNEAIAEAV